MIAGRVVVVATSPRLPPGLLSWSAWQALHSGSVLVRDAGHPQAPALADAGVQVSVLAGSDAVLSEQLHSRAAAGERVIWLAGPDDGDLVRALGNRVIADPSVVLEVVHGSYDPPGARLLDVVTVMDRLRSPGGCPWDAKQTHDSLKPDLLEEAYELYAAIEDGDRVDLREELGDVLLQVAFHARLAEDDADAPWSIDDVAGDLVDKLVRRHPHVFAGADGTDVERSWDAIKAKEKGGRTSVTDGVPLSQPALSLALKLQKRASRLGAPTQLPARAGDALAVELWDVVRRCREQRVDPEAALRSVARAFRDRLSRVEADVRSEGREPADVSPQEWSQRWS